MWKRGTEKENKWHLGIKFNLLYHIKGKVKNPPHAHFKKKKIVLVKSRNGRKCITKQGEKENYNTEYNRKGLDYRKKDKGMKKISEIFDKLVKNSSTSII